MSDARPADLGGAGTALRVAAAAQGALASVLAVTPERAISWIGEDRRLAPPTWLVRMLGVRSLAQAAALFVRPTAELATLGALVDATHAASMVAVAVSSRRYRRAAVFSGSVATVSAAGVLAVERRSRRARSTGRAA
jgi:hypothetical protein